MCVERYDKYKSTVTDAGLRKGYLLMHIDQFKEQIGVLENAYYAKPEGNPILGISVAHPVAKSIEEYIMPFLASRKINEYVFAWKAGTLAKENENKEDEKYIIKEMDGAYLTVYGTKIEKKALHDYLGRVSKAVVVGDDFEPIYNSLIKLNPPHNFGAVYMINLLFFLSGGEWPIYDRFAHKAAKALFMEKHPNQIYVGPAPSKEKEADVVNMYSEYIWFLEKLFGNKSIGRKIDRALWVYGHASGEYCL